MITSSLEQANGDPLGRVEGYQALPESLLVRNPGSGGCSRVSPSSLVIATTLLNLREEYSKDDLAQLYRARWNVELDWRSIKVVLQMDMLRCKTPEVVSKEIWMHVLAYNLIHTVMAQAASQNGISPRSISFKATLQVLEAFQPLIASQADRGLHHRQGVYQEVLRAIAQHRVADRPDRFEPPHGETQAEKLRPPDETAKTDQTRDDQVT